VIVRASFIDVDNDAVHDLLSDADAAVSCVAGSGSRLRLDGVTEIECASTADVW
jgi:hypothetical protein